jgi:hypothetical protein
MKKQLLVITTLAALLWAGSPVFAGGKKGAAANGSGAANVAPGANAAPAANGANAEVQKARQENRAVLRQFDTNSDGTIDGAERDALRAAYKAGKDAELKTFDTNSDGTLDDNEIAAIKARGAGGKAGKGKAAKKKKAAQ